MDDMSFIFGPFRLLPLERLLEREGEAVALGSRASEILLVLVENAGSVATKKELTARAWLIPLSMK